MSRFEKLLNRLLRKPTPNDVKFEEMAKFLISIGCTMRKKKGTSHRQFKYPNFIHVITLMEGVVVREYQIDQVIELLIFIGVFEEDI